MLELLDLGCGYIPAPGEVRFVAQDHDLYLAAHDRVHFGDPVLDVLEALPVRHVEDHDHSVRALVVGIGDGSVALLAGCVPLAERRVRSGVWRFEARLLRS